MSAQVCPSNWAKPADVGIDHHEELLASLSRINTYNPPVQTCSTGWSFSGFYKGPTSVAYLFYRLSTIYPDLTFKHQSLLEWAEAYLQLSQHVRKPPPGPSNCGIANETLAYIALNAVLNDDISLVKQLCDFSNKINDSSDDGSNEWLYGRAGYLYFLRMCQAHFDKSANAAGTLSTAIDRTITRIMQVPRPWTWHGKDYLGAAHGTTGIICQIVLSDPRTASQLCKSILPELLEMQLESGNLPSLASASHDDLIHFCHGAPGFLLSLRSIRGCLTTPDMQDLRDQIDKAITRAQEDIVARGLLKKNPCLCHGIAGNLLALDAGAVSTRFLAYISSQVLEENEQWMAKAGQTDDFVGLFTGEAGRAWVWAVADSHLEKTCIGFNDL